jgi:hypothetical protein
MELAHHPGFFELTQHIYRYQPVWVLLHIAGVLPPVRDFGVLSVQIIEARDVVGAPVGDGIGEILSGLPLGTRPPSVTRATLALERSRTGTGAGTDENVGGVNLDSKGCSIVSAYTIITRRSAALGSKKSSRKIPCGMYPSSRGVWRRSACQ